MKILRTVLRFVTGRRDPDAAAVRADKARAVKAAEQARMHERHQPPFYPPLGPL